MVIKLGVAPLTAQANGTNTDVTLTAPADTAGCYGPMVRTGKLTGPDIIAGLAPDAGLTDRVYPTADGFENVDLVVSAADYAAIDNPPANTPPTSFTVSLALESGPHTAYALCLALVDGAPVQTVYLRDIDHEATDAPPNPLFGSLGATTGSLLDVLRTGS